MKSEPWEIERVKRRLRANPYEDEERKEDTLYMLTHLEALARLLVD
jgi:hypothetical protein